MLRLLSTRWGHAAAHLRDAAAASGAPSSLILPTVAQDAGCGESRRGLLTGALPQLAPGGPSSGRWVGPGRGFARSFATTVGSEDDEADGPEDLTDVYANAHQFKVHKVTKTGEVERMTCSSRVLGLHSRDVAMFVDGTSSFAPQRSTITAREGAILVRLANGSIQAVIRPSHAGLLETDSQKALGKLANSIVRLAREASPLPFEFRVLEALLKHTSALFQKKLKVLSPLVESVLEELTDRIGTTQSNTGALFGRLLPLKRVLISVANDVREVHEAIGELLRDEAMVEAACLTSPADPPHLKTSPHHQLACDLLDSYLRQFRSIGGELQELAEAVDDTREMWEVGLDAARNSMLDVNIRLTMGTLGVAVAALPAAMLGMNMSSGLEALHPGAFFALCASLAALPVLLTRMLTDRIIAATHREADATTMSYKDVSSVKQLLQDLPLIEATIESLQRKSGGGGVSALQLKTALQTKLGRPFETSEVSLLFKALDRDKDGKLVATESFETPKVGSYVVAPDRPPTAPFKPAAV